MSAKKKAVPRKPRKLYKFEVHCGRMGSLEGIFAATEREVATAIGKTCYFGEVLGKHSEVELDLAPEHVVALTDDAAFIAKAEAYGLVPTGRNPLDYITCRNCGEPLSAPYTRCRKRVCREALGEDDE